jgi:hypothetical protein
LPIRYLPIATAFSFCSSSLIINTHFISLRRPRNGPSLTIPLSNTQFNASPAWTVVAMSDTPGIVAQQPVASETWFNKTEGLWKLRVLIQRNSFPYRKE